MKKCAIRKRQALGSEVLRRSGFQLVIPEGVLENPHSSEERNKKTMKGGKEAKRTKKQNLYPSRQSLEPPNSTGRVDKRRTRKVWILSHMLELANYDKLVSRVE